MELDGRIVAVTGAFGSLGKAVVQAALAAGARVAALDRAAAPADANAYSHATLYGGIDLADADAAQAAFDRVAADLGGIDALVNLAGGFRWETLESGTLETWDFLYQINVRTAVCASRAALPHLRRRGSGGRIVNVGAAGAAKAAAGMGAYAASKSGVAKLTEALAEELKDCGITVNAVLPSIIDTAPNRADMPDADYTRWVQPSELGGIVTFLLSARAQAITGALIPVVGRV